MMKLQKILSGIIFVLFCVGCSEKSESVAKIELPELFKTELTQYLKNASKLSTQTSQGLSYRELRDQRTEVKSSFDLLSELWPLGFCEDGKEKFGKAHHAFDLAVDLWGKQNEEYDAPNDGGVNGWEKYAKSPLADQLIIKTFADDYVVEKYRGRKYVSYDNTRVLLTIGSTFLNEGRKLILEELK